jgi:hypothetical protein
MDSLKDHPNSRLLPKSRRLTGVDIHGNVSQIQLGHCIVNALQISVMRISTLGNIHICNEVTQAIGLWGECQSSASMPLQGKSQLAYR